MNISLASDFKLMLLSTFLNLFKSYSRTCTADLKEMIQALEMKCYRRLLNISHKDHVTNEEVRSRLQDATGVYDDVLTVEEKETQMVWPHLKILWPG